MAVVSKILGSGCMKEPVNTNPAESCRPRCLWSPGDTNESLQGCKGSLDGHLWDQHKKKRLFATGNYENWLEERQIMGAVVLLNSVWPRMGFLIEKKLFRTGEVNCCAGVKRHRRGVLYSAPKIYQVRYWQSSKVLLQVFLPMAGAWN